MSSENTGDLRVIASDNPARYGYGGISLTGNLISTGTGRQDFAAGPVISAGFFNVTGRADSSIITTGAAIDFTIAANGVGSQLIVESDSALTVAGDTKPAIDIRAVGDVRVQNTTSSAYSLWMNTSSTIDHFAENVFIGSGVASTTTVRGDLVVNGTTTTVNTETLQVEDPIITVNVNETTGPASGVDKGMWMARSVTDAVSGPSQESSTTVASTATTITLAAAPVTLSPGDYGTDDYLNTFTIVVAGQTREITDWDGTGKVATITPAWGANPVPGDVYNLYARQVAFVWDESEEKFILVYTSSTALDTTIDTLGFADLCVGDLDASGSISGSSFKVVTVDLLYDSNAWVNIPMITDTTGSYQFLVEYDSTTVPAPGPYGAHGVFILNKANPLAGNGSVFTRRTNGAISGVERLRMRWPASGVPQIAHQGVNPEPGAFIITYRVRIITL